MCPSQSITSASVVITFSSGRFFEPSSPFIQGDVAGLQPLSPSRREEGLIVRVGHFATLRTRSLDDRQLCGMRYSPCDLLLLLFGNRELCTGDAKAPAGTGSRKCERNLPLRERLSLSRFDGARLGLSRRIRSEKVVDLSDLGELPGGVFHFGLTECDPAALEVDGHRERLAVVATDHTFAVGGLVDRRPAPEAVCELTLRLAGRRCRGRREREHAENQNCRKSRMDRMAHV